MPDGDVMSAREVFGGAIQKLTPYNREWDYDVWECVMPREVVRIEWNEPEESGEPQWFMMVDSSAHGPV